MSQNETVVLEKYTVLSESEVCILHYASNQGQPNVRYIFDKDTKKLIGVELIK